MVLKVKKKIGCLTNRLKKNYPENALIFFVFIFKWSLLKLNIKIVYLILHVFFTFKKQVTKEYPGCAVTL